MFFSLYKYILWACVVQIFCCRDTVDVLDINCGLGLQQQREKLRGAGQSGVVQRREAVGKTHKNRQREKMRPRGQGSAGRREDKVMKWVINHSDVFTAGEPFKNPD